MTREEHRRRLVRAISYVVTFASMVAIGRIPMGHEGVVPWPRCLLAAAAVTLVLVTFDLLDRRRS